MCYFEHDKRKRKGKKIAAIMLFFLLSRSYARLLTYELAHSENVYEQLLSAKN